MITPGCVCVCVGTCEKVKTRLCVYLVSQVGRQDGPFPLLEEVDDHESQDVRRQTSLLRSVHVTDLRQTDGGAHIVKNTGK